LLLGAILMTWLYNGTGGSVAAVAVWHALFDFFSGSQATDGLMNSVMSIVVALWAVGIAISGVELRGIELAAVGVVW
jgi:uncharacterized protein